MYFYFHLIIVETAFLLIIDSNFESLTLKINVTVMDELCILNC